jgi:predicted DNA-binding protein (MmcQ/YjbR family)
MSMESEVFSNYLIQPKHLMDYGFLLAGDKLVYRKPLPEFLWPNIPSYAAFRLKDSKKWYAIMGAVPRYKLDPGSTERQSVEVINVKVDSGQIKEILARDGYYPAFHMNKKCWVSIILNDTLSDSEIQNRISESYESL